MALNNFPKERSKYLYVTGSLESIEDSFYLSIIRVLCGDTIMQEKNLKSEEALLPYLREKLHSGEFLLPKNTNAHFISLFSKGEEALLVGEGIYDDQTYAMRNRAVRRIYDVFLKYEEENGKSDDALVANFLMNDGKISQKDPYFRQTMYALGKEDRIELRKELQNKLQGKHVLKESYDTEGLEKSPSKLRFDRCANVNHAILPTSDELDEDFIESLIFSPLT